MKSYDTGRKTGSRGFPAGLLLCLAVAFCPAPAVRAQEPADLIDTWTEPGLGGWTNNTLQSAISNPGGYLNMRFGAQFQPLSQYDIAQRDSTGLNLTNISFRFLAANAVPSAIRVYFHSTYSGHSWYVNLTPPTVGGWYYYDVPVNTQLVWSMGPEGTIDQFNADVEWVDWVGLYVRRGGEVIEQNYGIDDFRLLGFKLQDSDSDGMPDVWETANYLNPYDDSDATLDMDSDGVNNLNEYRAGTDPWDPENKFMLEIETTNKVDMTTGILVKWNSMRNRSYKIYRATDLTQGMSLYVSGVTGTPPVNVFEDVAATNSGPYFYKITVE